MLTAVIYVAFVICAGLYSHLYLNNEEAITNYLHDAKELEDNAKIKYTDDDYNFTYKLS